MCAPSRPIKGTKRKPFAVKKESRARKKLKAGQKVPFKVYYNRRHCAAWKGHVKYCMDTLGLALQEAKETNVPPSLLPLSPLNPAPSPATYGTIFLPRRTLLESGIIYIELSAISLALAVTPVQPPARPLLNTQLTCLKHPRPFPSPYNYPKSHPRAPHASPRVTTPNVPFYISRTLFKNRPPSSPKIRSARKTLLRKRLTRCVSNARQEHYLTTCALAKALQVLAYAGDC